MLAPSGWLLVAARRDVKTRKLGDQSLRRVVKPSQVRRMHRRWPRADSRHRSIDEDDVARFEFGLYWLSPEISNDLVDHPRAAVAPVSAAVD